MTDLDIFLIIGITVVGLTIPGLVFGGIALHRTLLYRSSLTWEQTDGRVVKTYITSRSSKRHFYRYTPHVVYEYRVAGKKLRGERLHFGEGFNSLKRERVEAFLEDYPLEMPVAVFYDPSHPELCVLERAMPKTRGYWIAAGMWFGTAGFMVMMMVALRDMFT